MLRPLPQLVPLNSLNVTAVQEESQKTHGVSPLVSKRHQSTEMNVIVYHQLRSLSPVKQMQNITSLSFPFEQGTLRVAGRLR